MRIAALILGISFTFNVIAGGNDRPVGENCNLSSPPPNAGEEINHGVVLRIYPRVKDIGATYSGCQVLFAPNGPNAWAIVGLTEEVKGDPVRVWSEYEKDSARLSCRFEQGKVVVGDPDKCPMPEFLLLQSLAPGCVAIIRDAVAKQGVGAPDPAQCQYQ